MTFSGIDDFLGMYPSSWPFWLDVVCSQAWPVCVRAVWLLFWVGLGMHLVEHVSPLAFAGQLPEMMGIRLSGQQWMGDGSRVTEQLHKSKEVLD